MKKRLFAILLIVALVFSAVAVLAACDNSNEFTVNFRKTGSIVFSLTTKDGKLSKADVDAATQKNIAKIDNRQNDGFFFRGWYADVSGEEPIGEINYAKVYTANANYEAYYEFAPAAGEDDGYTLIGVINGVQNWGADGLLSDDTWPNWKMTQDPEQGWLYSIETPMKGNDSLKVKTYNATWNGGEVNLGAPGLGEVTFEEGLLPENVQPTGAGNDGSCVVWGNFSGSNDMDNTFISKHVESATVVVTFNYRTKLYNMHFTALEWIDELPESEYILVGNFPEADWTPETDLESLKFQKTETDGLVTISHDFSAGLKWRIKTNESGYNETYGYSHLGTITKGEDLVNVATIPSDLLVDANDFNNMIVNYDCTLTINFNISTQRIDVVVTAITIPEPDAPQWESAGYVIAGVLNGVDTWNTFTTSEARLFKQVDDTDVGTLEFTFKAKDQFKINTNVTNWGGQVHIGFPQLGSITFADGVNKLEGLFKALGTDGNVEVWANCKVKFTLHVEKPYTASYVDIEVLECDDELYKEPENMQYMLSGDMNGWATQTSVEAYIFTNEGGGIYTLTISMSAQANGFKVKKNSGSWDGEWNWNNVSWGEGAQAKFTASGTNIKCVTACTVKLTLNLNTNTLTIELAA